MNWGQGIAIFLTVFVLFILGLIYKTTQSTFDLEVEDYYAQEIGYPGQFLPLKFVTHRRKVGPVFEACPGDAPHPDVLLLPVETPLSLGKRCCRH